jgi:hypothetical protein
LGPICLDHSHGSRQPPAPGRQIGAGRLPAAARRLAPAAPARQRLRLRTPDPLRQAFLPLRIGGGTTPLLDRAFLVRARQDALADAPHRRARPPSPVNGKLPPLPPSPSRSGQTPPAHARHPSTGWKRRCDCPKPCGIYPAQDSPPLTRAGRVSILADASRAASLSPPSASDTLLFLNEYPGENAPAFRRFSRPSAASVPNRPPEPPPMSESQKKSPKKAKRA